MREIDLFIMSGQSNMQGQSECKAEKELPAEAGYEYKYLTDSLEPIRHPIGEDIITEGEPLLLGAHMKYGNLVPSFAENYYRQSGRKACYAHCAKGSTVISDWLKGTKRYDALVDKTNGAVKCLQDNGYQIARKNIIWLQGESDGIVATKKEEYTERILSFWKDLQNDLSLDHFMIIRIAKFYDFPCIPIMAAQEELCRLNNSFVMLTRITGTFTVQNGYMQSETAPFHYTNAGYDYTGKIAGTNAALYLDGIPFSLEDECYDELM